MSINNSNSNLNHFIHYGVAVASGVLLFSPITPYLYSWGRSIYSATGVSLSTMVPTCVRSYLWTPLNRCLGFGTDFFENSIVSVLSAINGFFGRASIRDFIGSVIVAPILEEVVFRWLPVQLINKGLPIGNQVLQQRFSVSLNHLHVRRVNAIFSTYAFTMAHDQWQLGAQLRLLAVGSVCCLIHERWGLGPAIVTHSVYNFCTYLFFSGGNARTKSS